MNSRQTEKDWFETVTFHLTLDRGELEGLYWWDMEADDETYAKIEQQLIEQGFRDEKYRKYDQEDV